MKLYRGWPITIVDSHDKTPLYSDKQKKPGFRASAAVALVKELRQEIEGESKK